MGGGLISLTIKFVNRPFGQIFTSAKINFKSKINEYEKYPILGATFYFGGTNKGTITNIKNRNHLSERV